MTDPGLGGLIAGSVVAVALAAFKLVERIIDRKGKTSCSAAFTESDRGKLRQVVEVVARTDAEGVPLTYVPRRLITIQEGQVDLLRQLGQLAREQSDTNKTLARQIADHERREEAELRAIRGVLEKNAGD